ncbi:MAG: hypothetical protein WDM79_17410 [Terricaulis sp.]
MAEGKVPVLESVGGALRFVRANLSLVVILSLVSAVLTTALAMGSAMTAATAPALGFVFSLLTTFVSATIFAGLVSAAVKGAAGLGARLTGDALRLWTAMAILILFFTIVFVVLIIPAAFVIGMTMGPYLSDLQAAGSDNNAVMAVMMNYMQANPGPLLAGGSGLYFDLAVS